MWVRIREISFPAENTDQVVDHVRNTLVARSSGEGFRGYRLLLDRPDGRALEVSYWQTEVDARSIATSPVDPTGVAGGAVVETNYYEIGIDAG